MRFREAQLVEGGHARGPLPDAGVPGRREAASGGSGVR